MLDVAVCHHTSWSVGREAQPEDVLVRVTPPKDDGWAGIHIGGSGQSVTFFVPPAVALKIANAIVDALAPVGAP